MAAAIQQRWNFALLLPTDAEYRDALVDSMKRRTSRIADAFSAVSKAADKRASNVRNAAAAFYLLQAARTQPCYLSGANDVRALQLAALGTTLQDDAYGLNQLMQTYTPVREALNHATQQMAEMDEAPAAGNDTWEPSQLSFRQSVKDKDREKFAVTVGLSDLARERTFSLLRARTLDSQELVAILEAESIAREQDKRQTFASFAPAPPRPGPAYNALIDPDTPMPEINGERRRKPEDPPPVELPQDRGLVLAAPPGTPVLAGAAGSVEFIGEIRGLGNALVLQHENGLFSVYAYLSGFDVSADQKVTAGQVIARAGVIPGTETGGIRLEVRRGKVAVEVSEVLGPGDQAAKILKR